MILNDNDMSISPNVGAHVGLPPQDRARPDLPSRARGRRAHPEKAPGGPEAPAGLAESARGRLQEGSGARERSSRSWASATSVRSTATTYPSSCAPLREAKQMEGPVLLHVLHPVKGKGYQFAENDPVHWHGPAPFPGRDGRDLEKGRAAELHGTSSPTRSRSRPKRIPAVVGAHGGDGGRARESTASRRGSRAAPSTWASASSTPCFSRRASRRRVLRPVCAIYSTFLQRAYDQIMHDVCLMDLPVVFALDRAGSSARTVRRTTGSSI